MQEKIVEAATIFEGKMKLLLEEYKEALITEKDVWFQLCAVRRSRRLSYEQYAFNYCTQKRSA